MSVDEQINLALKESHFTTEDYDSLSRSLTEDLSDNAEKTSGTLSLDKINAFLSNYNRILESEQEQVLGYLNKFPEHFSLNATYRSVMSLAQEELEALKDAPFDRILHITDGSLPYTAVAYHTLTGKNVDCINPDGKRVDNANKLLTQLQLNDHVKTFQVEAALFDLRKYNLILIDPGVEMKWRVLSHIRKSANRSCYVVCRVYKGVGAIISGELNHDKVPGLFRYREITSAFEPIMKSSIFCSKAKSLALVNFRWVKELTLQDKERIIHLMNLIIAREPGIGYAQPLNEEEGMALMENMQSKIAKNEKYVLLAEVDGELVGHSIFTPNQSLNNKHLGEISRTFISPQFRGIGLEWMGLKEFVKLSRELGIEKLVLDVRGGTAAEKKWSSIGFKTYGVLPDYSRVRGRSYDGVYMYQDVNDLAKVFAGPS